MHILRQRGNLCVMLAMFPTVLALPATGQQRHVTRYDVFAGYAFLDSPQLNLLQNGFAAQVGFRPRTWVSAGFDYSLSRGDATVTSGLLTNALQRQVRAQLAQLAAAGMLPSGYQLVLPARARTQTFAVGAQLVYRHFTDITLFFRPVSVGAIHEVVTPKPSDPIAAAVLAQLAPSGRRSDAAWFLGFGGGFDILLSKHFAIRTQADLVYDHLFSDILKDGRFTLRFSVGPAFNFGRNIVK